MYSEPYYSRTAMFPNYQTQVPMYQRPPPSVFWAQSPQGWIPVSPDPFFSSYTSHPVNINNYWCDPTATDFNNVIPQLSTEVSGKCVLIGINKPNQNTRRLDGQHITRQNFK